MIRLGESYLREYTQIQAPEEDSEIHGEMVCFEYGLFRISAARLLENRRDFDARETLLNLGEKLNLEKTIKNS